MLAWRSPHLPQSRASHVAAGSWSEPQTTRTCPSDSTPRWASTNFEFPSPCGGETCPEAKAHLTIYHCPFCGGAAPPSKRETLFTHISDQEAARLYRMFDGMRTLEEVVRAVGPPDDDIERGLTVREPEKEGKPPRLRTYRTLHYTHLIGHGRR